MSKEYKFNSDLYGFPADFYINKDEYAIHENSCGLIGDDWNWELSSDGRRGCNSCGWVDPYNRDHIEESADDLYYRELSRGTVGKPFRVHISHETRLAFKAAGFRVQRDGSVRTTSFQTKGRYRPEFHFNERIAQWCMYDPKIPENDWNYILHKTETGKYGPPSKFTRATVIEILRDIRLTKYRERWKSILNKLNPEACLSFPSHEVISYMETLFKTITRQFYRIKHTMPPSVVKAKDGTHVTRQRHNLLSYNYICRKILEMCDIWCWHSEFPVPVSVGKLKILDDIMEQICRNEHLSFIRTVPMKIPKYKRSKKEKEEIAERKKSATEAVEFAELLLLDSIDEEIIKEDFRDTIERQVEDDMIQYRKEHPELKLAETSEDGKAYY